MEASLTTVLSSYGLHNVSVKEKTVNVYKVEDNFQSFCLKKSRLTEERLAFFSHVYWLANSQQLNAILPIYLTIEGQIVQPWKDQYFYLTPWLDQPHPSFDDNEIKDFYRNIGTIHQKTKRPQQVEFKRLKESFSSYQTYCKESHTHLARYVQLFEQKEYMSPFELLVCTQYRDITHAFHEMNKRLNQFLAEDAAFSWSTSLCHMNLRKSHLIDSYIINWEHARMDNAVIDLAIFFQNETKKYGHFGKKLLDNFHAYLNVNKLSDKELQLLVVYLLSISNYLTIIQNYVSKTSKEAMTGQIIRLQQEYRNILFGIAFSQYVEREFETVSFEDLDL